MTVRALDDETKKRLRIRAAQNGHSMEQEARDILRAALADPEAPEPHWVDQIISLFGKEHGIEPGELPIAPREHGPLSRVTFDE